MEKLSFSALSTYLMCGEKYRRSYVEKEWLPPNATMIRGKCIHYAQEINAKNIMSGAKPMDNETAVALALTYWEKAKLDIAWREFELEDYIIREEKRFDKMLVAERARYAKAEKALDKTLAAQRKTLLSEHRKSLKGLKEGKEALEKEHEKELELFDIKADKEKKSLEKESEDVLTDISFHRDEKMNKLNSSEEYVVEQLEKEYEERIKLLTAAYNEAFGDIKPYFAEKKFQTMWSGSYPFLVGVFDLIEEGGVIVDTKTSSKSPQADDIENDFQLTLYEIIYRIVYGQPPSKLVKRWVIDTIEPKTVEQECGHRSDKAIERAKRRLKVSINCMQKGIYLPPYPGSWWCCEKWCGYWEDCQLKP